MPSLYDNVRNMILEIENPLFTVSEIMAVAYAETVANPWWCSCSSTDRAMLLALPARSDVGRQFFKKHFTVAAGVNKGKFPRFKFEPKMWEQVQTDGAFRHLPDYELVAMACRWGMFQQSAYWLTFQELPADMIGHLMRFNASPARQILVAMNAFQTLLPQAGGDFALAASRYRSYGDEQEPSDYGVKVQRIAQHFFERGCV
jgi:hypothetical protein